LSRYSAAKLSLSLQDDAHLASCVPRCLYVILVDFIRLDLARPSHDHAVFCAMWLQHKCSTLACISPLLTQ